MFDNTWSSTNKVMGGAASPSWYCRRFLTSVDVGTRVEQRRRVQALTSILLVNFTNLCTILMVKAYAVLFYDLIREGKGDFKL